MKIDLNCDMGESFGVYTLGDDAALLDYVTSVNLACGFHAADPTVMAKTVKLVAQKKLALGAHPAYPDLAGFGRREMALTPEEVQACVLYQIGALAGFARANRVDLVHVKPHGALYNTAARHLPTALAVANAVKAFSADLILVGLAGSKLIEAAHEIGLPCAAEAFPDRAYLPDGSLMPRSQPAAVLHDPAQVAEGAVQLARQGIMRQNSPTPLKVDTLCLHGDHPESAANARLVQQALKQSGIQVEALPKHPPH